MTSPRVLIIGRPNVGKSTLFNYWVGHRMAIESQISGTTRDFIEQEVRIQKRRVKLIDTAGFEKATPDKLLKQGLEKTQNLLPEVDLILFLVSAEDGLHSLDRQIAKLLRQTKKPIVFAAAQADNTRREEIALTDFWSLGLDAPLPFSVKQKTGLQKLEEAIIAKIKKVKISRESKTSATVHPIRLALLGRPNVGKSSLLNAILKKERVIVSDIPGTTRDLIEIPFTYKQSRQPSKSSKDATEPNKKNSPANKVVEHPFILIDTAGLRRPGRRGNPLEFFSADRSQKAIDHADIVGIVIDSHESLTRYDLNIGKQVIKSGRGLFFIANKWDLLEEEQKVFLQENLGKALRTLAEAPTVAVSALTGSRISTILDTALRIYEKLHIEIGTSYLNKIFSSERSILFLNQKGNDPPLFEVSVRGSKKPPASFQRRLENHLRREMDLAGIPIHWRFQTKEKWSSFVKRRKDLDKNH